MECKKIQEMLAAYLERVVSPEERKRVEDHLTTCHRCGTILQDLKRTEELVKGLEEMEPPPWLKQRVMTQVRAQGEAKRSAFRKLFYPLHVKVPLEAFVTVLIAVAAIYVFRAGEPEMKRAQPPSTGEEVIRKNEVSREVSPREKLPRDTPRQKVFSGGPPQGRADLPAPGGETRATESFRSGYAEGVGTQRDREEGREKRESLAARAEESPSREEQISLSQEPPSAARQKDEQVAGRAMKREERNALPAAPAGMRAFAKKRAGDVGVTLHVSDIRTASKETETVLGQLGAWRIERDSAGGGEVITAGLQTGKLKALFEKLKTLGEVREKDAPHPPPGLPLEGRGKADIAEGTATIRIEIIGSP